MNQERAKWGRVAGWCRLLQFIWVRLYKQVLQGALVAGERWRSLAYCSLSQWICAYRCYMGLLWLDFCVCFLCCCCLEEIAERDDSDAALAAKAKED